MNRKLAFLVGGAISLAPLAALASAVTYDFTGTVPPNDPNFGAGIYSSSGPTISGSFTVDYGNAIPGQSFGTPGSSTETWLSLAQGGAVFGTSVPAGLVFSMSFTTGGVSFTSPGIGGDGVNSSVLVNFDAITPQHTLTANEVHFFNGGYTLNSITLVASGAGGTLDANGFPLPLSPNLGNVGLLYNYAVDPNGPTVTISALAYHIDSITLRTASPVPLPAAAWLMLSGLGGLGAMARKRKAMRAA
jgi:hypothetical protein